MPADTQGPIHFLNIEYFFRILYETIIGVRGPTFQTDLVALLTHFWLIITALSVAVSAGCIAILVYSTIRYRQTVAEDAAKYATIHDAVHEEEEVEHRRWKHVMELIESAHESDWRQAILEADIILFDALAHDGYPGESLGEKLKAVDPRRFASLQEAWEAHKIRNEIAHQGSAFVLSDKTAYRTIQQYETVLREFGEIV